MTVPVLKVEIAFVSDALATAPTWVDVTSYVRVTPPVTIKRGRPDELTAYQAGTAQLTLSNRDRRFDPTYASGPYYGYLTPGRQIQITCTHSATTYPIFRGWVLGWPQSFGSVGLDATVTIQCTDALGWMAKARMPDDLIDDVTAGVGTLTGFLRNTDDYVWQDSVGSNDATLLIGTRSSSTGLALGASSPAITFNGSTAWQLPTSWAPAGSFSVSFWMRSSTNKDKRTTLLGGKRRNFIIINSGSAVYIDTDGRLAMESSSYSGLTNSSIFVTDIIVGDGQPHHVVLAGDGTPDGFKMYVDGIRRTLTETRYYSGGSLQRIDAIGLVSTTEYIVNLLTSYVPLNGAIQDLAWFDSEVSAAGVTTLYDYGRAYVAESSTARVNRVLGDAGWPTAWKDISAGLRSECGQLDYNGRTVIDVIQEIERTENGRLFAARDGDVMFLSRYFTDEDPDGTTSQATFSDDGADIPYSTLAFRYDDIDVINDVVVNCPPIGRGRATNAASLLSIGAKSRSVNTILTRASDAANMASALVALESTPVLRTDPIMVIPEVVPANWPTVLGLELGNRVTFEVTPMGVGTQMVEEMTLEQIGWQIQGPEWVMTVAGAPITVGFFVLDVSSLDGPDILGY